MYVFSTFMSAICTGLGDSFVVFEVCFLTCSKTSNPLVVFYKVKGPSFSPKENIIVALNCSKLNMEPMLFS